MKISRENKNKVRKFMLPAFAVALLLSSVAVRAEGSIRIQGAKIKHVPSISSMTAAFMVIHNDSGQDIKLIKAHSSLARSTELHTMTIGFGGMKMRPVKDILIKAQSSTELKRGGLHIMLIGLKQELKSGSAHEITLTFSNGQILKIQASVE